MKNPSSSLTRRAFFRRAGAIAAVFPPLIAGIVKAGQPVEETRAIVAPGRLEGSERAATLLHGDSTWDSFNLASDENFTYNANTYTLTLGNNSITDDLALMKALA